MSPKSDTSLHTKHGKQAPKVLQKIMKTQVDVGLPKEFEVTDKGNYYLIKRGDKITGVPLFAANEVFHALQVFCSEKT